MEKRLADAGFAASDMQVIEPFPKKGNLVLRYKGTGAKQPILLLAQVLAYLDRVNIGTAKLQMAADLSLSATAYGLGAALDKTHEVAADPAVLVIVGGAVVGEARRELDGDEGVTHESAGLGRRRSSATARPRCGPSLRC